MRSTALLLSLFGSAEALSLSPGVRAPASSAHVRAAAATPAAAVRTSGAHLAAVDTTNECGVVAQNTEGCEGPLSRKAPFGKVMAANRAEIAVRIHRACTELNMQTVAIFGYEDRYSMHRWGADQSFMLDKAPEASPISAYLDIDQIISIAKVRPMRNRPAPHTP